MMFFFFVFWGHVGRLAEVEDGRELSLKLIRRMATPPPQEVLNWGCSVPSQKVELDI